MGDSAIIIRYAQSNDNILLAELGAQTFYESYAADNSSEDMADYLAQNFGPDKQASELADPGIVILIAEIEGVAVGYVSLRSTAADASIPGERPLELVRIYSLRQWIGRGVGPALMQAALQEAHQRGHDSIWLGVWECNRRARAFYQKWGFSEVGTHTFVLGSDIQHDLLLQRTPAGASQPV